MVIKLNLLPEQGPSIVLEISQFLRMIKTRRDADADVVINPNAISGKKEIVWDETYADVKKLFDSLATDFARQGFYHFKQSFIQLLMYTYYDPTYMYDDAYKSVPEKDKMNYVKRVVNSNTNGFAIYHNLRNIWDVYDAVIHKAGVASMDARFFECEFPAMEGFPLDSVFTDCKFEGIKGKYEAHYPLFTRCSFKDIDIRNEFTRTEPLKFDQCTFSKCKIHSLRKNSDVFVIFDHCQLGTMKITDVFFSCFNCNGEITAIKKKDDVRGVVYGTDIPVIVSKDSPNTKIANLSEKKLILSVKVVESVMSSCSLALYGLVDVNPPIGMSDGFRVAVTHLPLQDIDPVFVSGDDGIEGRVKGYDGLPSADLSLETSEPSHFVTRVSDPVKLNGSFTTSLFSTLLWGRAFSRKLVGQMLPIVTKIYDEWCRGNGKDPTDLSNYNIVANRIDGFIQLFNSRLGRQGR